MIEHADVARAAFTASALPPPPRTAADALDYITTLLGRLPTDEQCGYVAGPSGGENVWSLPTGRVVRVSRVMTPDGQIYKVMNNAPNGGPQWVAEDVRPDLYVPFTPTAPFVPPTPPGEDATLVARIQLLETRASLLWEVYAELARQIGTINQQLAALDVEVVRKPLPDYIAQRWGLTIVSQPRG